MLVGCTLQWDACGMHSAVGFWDGKDSGILGTLQWDPGTLGHCPLQDVPSIPGTLGWEGQWDFRHSAVGHLGHVQDGSMSPAMSPGTLGWEGQWDFKHSAVGHLGHVRDVPSIPGALGWEGQWDFRHSRSGTLGTCLGCPQHSRDSGMGRTLGFRHSAVGRSGHVRDVPSIPGALG